MNKKGKPRTYLQSFLREDVLKISFVLVFVFFSLVYYVIQLIMTRDIENELAVDVLCKIKAVDLTA